MPTSQRLHRERQKARTNGLKAEVEGLRDYCMQLEDRIRMFEILCRMLIQEAGVLMLSPAIGNRVRHIESSLKPR